MFKDDLESALKELAAKSDADLRIIIAAEIPESASRQAAEHLLDARKHKEVAVATKEAERRHLELIEVTNGSSGVHITSGGDTNISGGSVAGRDVLAPSNPPSPHGYVVVKWVAGIAATIVSGLIVGYLKGWFPTFLK